MSIKCFFFMYSVVPKVKSSFILEVLVYIHTYKIKLN